MKSNPFTLTAVNESEDNVSKVIFSNESKAKTVRELTKLVSNGVVVKRGYDYFYTSDESIRIDKNF